MDNKEKKAVINLKHNDKQCFKRTVLVALQHCIIPRELLQHHEDLDNWNVLDFHQQPSR